MHRDALKIRRKWKNGEPVLGPFIQLPAPGEVEIFANAGFDLVIIDLEHGALNFETAENMMRAAHAKGIAPFARVLANRPEFIVGALNIGAAGILVPHVDSAVEARAAVSATRFGPAGTRGVCPFVRSADYSSANGPGYYQEANETVIAGILLEGRAAYEELDDILMIDELDLIMVAPYDLSQSLGMTGDIYNPKVIATVEDVCSRARAAGKVVGVFAEEPARGAEWVGRGVGFVGMDVDSQIIRRAATAQLQQFSRALSTASNSISAGSGDTA